MWWCLIWLRWDLIKLDNLVPKRHFILPDLETSLSGDHYITTAVKIKIKTISCNFDQFIDQSWLIPD